MKLMLTAAAAAIAASIGAAGAHAQGQIQQGQIQPQAQTPANLFAAIDDNNDGAISRSEFVSYASEEKGVSEADAEEKFEKLLKTERKISKEAFLRSEELRGWTRAENAAAMTDRSSGIAAFRAIDENDDNEITRAEFTAFARDEADMSKSQAHMLFDDIADDSGRLSRVEFLAAEDRVQPIVQAYGAGDGSADEASNPHFEAMDDDSDGVVSKSEFATFIADADNVTKREARRLFDAVAGDDREMTLAEFVSGGERIERISENIAGEPGPLLKSARASRPDARDQVQHDRPAARTAAQQARDSASATFVEMDRDNDGEIDKQEFVEMARRRAEEEFDRIAGRDDAVSRDELADAEVELIHTSRLED